MNVQARINRHKGGSDMNTEATTINESAPTKAKSSKRESKEASPKTVKARSKKSAKAKVGKKSQKAAKSGTKERTGTKKAIVLEMLRRKEGATTAEIAKATNWQNHTIRGFISGTVSKKMGLTVESAKNDAGERTYRIGN
jgi:hypothetical protein